MGAKSPPSNEAELQPVPKPAPPALPPRMPSPTPPTPPSRPARPTAPTEAPSTLPVDPPVQIMDRDTDAASQAKEQPVDHLPESSVLQLNLEPPTPTLDEQAEASAPPVAKHVADSDELV